MEERGTISYANTTATAHGCAVGQSCVDCAGFMLGATAISVYPAPQTEHRMLLRETPDDPPVWGLDSASLAAPEDANHIVICGSHGEALGGRPETAFRYDAVALVFNDAGIGIDSAGTSRLPALDGRDIPAATVSAASARIGDAKSIYEDGEISRVNESAAARGCQPGQSTATFVDAIITSLK